MLYIHVDDFAFGHENEDVANCAAMVVMATLKRIGFLIELTPTYKITKIVGLAPGGFGVATFDIPLVRAGDIDRALEHLESAPLIAPEFLQTVVSIYCWFALMWRPAFSAVGNTFQWLERNRGGTPLRPVGFGPDSTEPHAGLLTFYGRIHGA